MGKTFQATSEMSVAPQEQVSVQDSTPISTDLSLEDTMAVNQISQTVQSAQTPQVNQIINTGVPVVVFVGPPSSGKSMILVRLAKFLRNQGFTVKPDETFLNTPQYIEGCREFRAKLNTNVALDGTVKYLLVDVYDQNHRAVAKLLEAPGEDFYDPDPKTAAKNNNGLKPYLTTIMASKNPKSYVVLLDLDSEISFRNDSSHREGYMQRFLDDFYPNINNQADQIVLLYNKIDTTPWGSIHACNDKKGAREDAKLYYEQLFNTMKVTTLGGFLTVDNFTFHTFCTGIFAKQQDDMGNNYETYNVANDCYPDTLWKEITKKW